VKTADERLRGLTTTAVGAERASDGLASSFRSLVAPLLAAASAGAALHKIMGETAAYEKLIARLSGVTGGAAQAREAFDKLEKISDSTMATENEMAEAFLKLSHAGLEPSERALRAYSDMAAATGGTLEGLTETTISASMGMMRGLKSLGIQGEAEGNRLKMTFRGVTEVIKNDAQSIQNYLIKIAETHYAGEAARQLDTLGGAVKRLQDEWGDLFREVGKSSVGDLLRQSLSGAAEAVQAISSALISPTMTNAVSMFQKLMVATASTADSFANHVRVVWGAVTGEDMSVVLRRFNAQQKGSEYATTAVMREIETERQAALARNAARGAGGELPEVGGTGSSGRGKAAGGYTPRIMSPTFELDFAARAKDKEAELLKLMEGDEKMRRLEEQYQRERELIADAKAREREELATTYASEQEQLDLAHAKRLKSIEAALASEALTREEYDAYMDEEAEKSARDRREYLNAQYEATAGSAAQTFESLGQVAKRFGGEQSKTYAALFATSKAFSAAQAAVSIATGMAKAQELVWPANLAEYTRIALIGAQLAADIAGAQYAGAYDRGGYIPAGGVGLVGERGPELVRGPANVTGRADTARQLEVGPSNVTIYNGFDDSFVHAAMAGAMGEKIIMNAVRKNSTTVRSLVRA